MLGPEKSVILHLLGRSAESWKGMEMELIGAAFPLLQGATRIGLECHSNLIFNVNVSFLEIGRSKYV